MQTLLQIFSTASHSALSDRAVTLTDIQPGATQILLLKHSTRSTYCPRFRPSVEKIWMLLLYVTAAILPCTAFFFYVVRELTGTLTWGVIKWTALKIHLRHADHTIPSTLLLPGEAKSRTAVTETKVAANCNRQSSLTCASSCLFSDRRLVAWWMQYLIKCHQPWTAAPIQLSGFMHLSRGWR